MSASFAMAAPSSPASSASILSSSASCSSLSSSRSTCSSDASIASSSSIRLDAPPRPNEHLAVLLPKQLWKADASASHCDNFYCRVPFSIWERRHHCRKCGGVFCQPCTARSTALLDASNLAFLHPPRNTPLAAFESPQSPIIDARVCDDCFDQIHGLRSPELPLQRLLPRPALSRTQSLLSSPISLFAAAKSPMSKSMSVASAPSSPPKAEHSILPPGGLTRTRPRSRPASLRAAHTHTRPSSPRSATLPSEGERSYGELDAYPLRRASLLCKAAGGGRWEPKPEPVDPALRVPIIGGKAPYELEMEREEAEERRRRSNPVIKDGDFQYRFPAMCDPEPVVLERPPIQFSTF
ncbi:FYVE zinc finger-domain-containing protein [Mycena alexandri]|uniref:FYVE zinc finger-domain-containing protein n=1 Tax=Mycena alexandri TaxID=1745969 RepID=A0AAD6X1M4_9AGAR|nr:FYVE zinc finger-domain-containing protein [Mycena alexandri]KAJ7037406.1 FYVE zinc finger-domain-containing protein [Mycena alexandri]